MKINYYMYIMATYIDQFSNLAKGHPVVNNYVDAGYLNNTDLSFNTVNNYFTASAIPVILTSNNVVVLSSDLSGIEFTSTGIYDIELSLVFQSEGLGFTDDLSYNFYFSKTYASLNSILDVSDNASNPSLIYFSGEGANTSGIGTCKVDCVDIAGIKNIHLVCPNKSVNNIPLTNYFSCKTLLNVDAGNVVYFTFHTQGLNQSVKIKSYFSAILLSTSNMTPIPPGVAGNVSGIPGDGEVFVNWSISEANGSDVIYDISANPSAPAVPSTGLTYVNYTGLTNGIGYTFTVTPSNIAGAGDASSNLVPIVPLAPV